MGIPDFFSLKIVNRLGLESSRCDDMTEILADIASPFECFTNTMGKQRDFIGRDFHVTAVQPPLPLGLVLNNMLISPVR
jgi:hypothetical protein